MNDHVDSRLPQSKKITPGLVKKSDRIKVALVRGCYLNKFEGQNYIFDPESIELVGVSSLKSIHSDFDFPVIRLPSIADYLDSQRIVKVIANRTFGDSQILFGLAKLASQFDIFHTADPHYYYSYQLAKLRSQGKINKLIVTSWETIPYNNESVSAKRKIKYFVLRQADHFLCYTEKAKECLVKEGVEEKKITVIRLGVNLNRFQIPISKSQFSNKLQLSKTIKILFVGRLVEEKGVMDLYEAFKNVKAQNSNIKSLKLLIIGDGPLKYVLEKKIKKDRMARYVSIEKKSYEEIPDVYRRADLFVLPSHHTKTWEEQYGMVLVEAMASGIPIIAYDSGAIREVVDDAGIYIHEGDIGGLAFAIKNMIADKSFAVKLGRIGRKRAEKEFDSRKTAKKIEQLYKNII